MLFTAFVNEKYRDKFPTIEHVDHSARIQTVSKEDNEFIYNVIRNFKEKTGVGIASIAFTELYLALQTGTVAAQENPPNFIRAQKFNEVQRYLMLTNHVPQMQVYFASEQKLAGLDEKTRAALQSAAEEATNWTTQQAKDSQESDIAWLTGPGGMQKAEIDMAGIDDLIKAVPEEVLGADGRKLYERILAAKP